MDSVDVCSLIFVRAIVAPIGSRHTVYTHYLSSSPGIYDMDMIPSDERVLHRRDIMHGAHRSKMSSTDRRYQSLVRSFSLHNRHHTVTLLP